MSSSDGEKREESKNNIRNTKKHQKTPKNIKKHKKHQTTQKKHKKHQNQKHNKIKTVLKKRKKKEKKTAPKRIVFELSVRKSGHFYYQSDVHLRQPALPAAS